MSRELIRNHPDIRQYTTIWMDSLRDGASSLVNTNRLIRFYQGATGLKTGSTDSALYCLSGTAERDGMELIAVIMKAPTSTQRFEDATNLLNYGFSTYTLENVVPESALPPVPVSLGTQATVQPVLGENTHLLLEKAKRAACSSWSPWRTLWRRRWRRAVNWGPSPSPPGKRSWRSCPSWQERRSHGSPSARCWSRCCGRPSSAADGGGGAAPPEIPADCDRFPLCPVSEHGIIKQQTRAALRKRGRS